MAHYKLDFSQNQKTARARRNRSRWGTTVIWVLSVTAFGLVLFGSVGTVFKQRTSHLTLRQEYEQLALKYDSLYALKIQNDKKIAELQSQLQKK
jgi:hypothetical protein